MTLPASATPTWELLASPEQRALELFDPASLDNLPEPAARWLRRVLPDQTPLIGAIELVMRGEIRIGRWMPFTATQILRAGVGFVWKPVVGGRLLRFVGADILGPDDARMEFRLFGRIPFVSSSGPDTARSAIGRLAIETVVWIPQAATPQAGALWHAIDADRAVVTLTCLGQRIDVTIAVDDDGQLRSAHLDRWNSAHKPPGFQPFGGDITSEFVAPSGVLIAGSGTVGWNHEASGWAKGQFFRFDLQHVDAVAAASSR